MSDGFQLTGRHVLAALIGFFLVVAAANAIMIRLAVQSFPGEQEKKSYMQGLDFNERLERRAAQARLGWSASIDEARLDGSRAVITIAFIDAVNAPIDDLSISGVVARSVNDDADREIVFSPVGAGVYTATADSLAPGLWILNATAVPEGGASDAIEFEFNAKLNLK